MYWFDKFMAIWSVYCFLCVIAVFVIGILKLSYIIFELVYVSFWVFPFIIFFILLLEDYISFYKAREEVRRARNERYRLRSELRPKCIDCGKYLHDTNIDILKLLAHAKIQSEKYENIKIGTFCCNCNKTDQVT